PPWPWLDESTRPVRSRIEGLRLRVARAVLRARVLAAESTGGDGLGVLAVVENARFDRVVPLAPRASEGARDRIHALLSASVGAGCADWASPASSTTNSAATSKAMAPWSVSPFR